MKNLLRFLLIVTLYVNCFCSYSQSVVGEIKNYNNTTIVTFYDDGTAKDINNDLLFTIDSLGNIVDGNNDHIGKISGNQTLDWDNNVLYTLDGSNKILDINSDELGSVNTSTKEVILNPSNLLGTYVDIPPIYAVYYFFQFSE